MERNNEYKCHIRLDMLIRYPVLTVMAALNPFITVCENSIESGYNAEITEKTLI